MCLNFFLIKIGNDNKIKVDTSIVVDVMNTAQQSAINSGTNIIETINTIIVNNAVTGVFNCPDGFNIRQTNVQNTQIVNSFTVQQISNIQTNIVDRVKSGLSQSQVQGILKWKTYGRNDVNLRKNIIQKTK